MVAAWQLLELGFTHAMIRRRLDAGRLYQREWGVYSLTPSITGKGRLMAAVLACGPKAALSHNAAAAVWDIGPWPTGTVHVTAPTKHARRGLVIHRAGVEPITRDGFPVTTVARTLIDLASLLSLHRLELPTRSKFERMLPALCKRHNLPLPAQNVSVAGEDVDAYWQESNLVVELDSWEFHKTRRAFEHDRQKAAALERAGIRVLRFTWNQLRREEATVAATIGSKL